MFVLPSLLKEKTLVTKLVATYDTPIHEDLSVIHYYTHYIPLSYYSSTTFETGLIHHLDLFLQIDHFTVVGFNLYPTLE